jgi:8-oxo-dGTP pyrophosphatase MutT (NUDIX family)
MIHDKQPIDFISNMEVVACLFESEGKTLYLHRHDHKPEGNKWGLPGGKIDKEDGSAIKAMIREIKEETGLTIQEEDLNFYKTFFVSHLGNNFLYHYFNCKLEKIPVITIAEKEHKDFIWLTPQEALNMTLVMDEDYCLKDYYKIAR